MLRDGLTVDAYSLILYLYEPIMPSIFFEGGGGKYCNSNKTNSHSNQKHLPDLIQYFYPPKQKALWVRASRE